MDYYTESTIESSALPGNKTTFMVFHQDIDDKGPITVVVSTGASRLQTYATRDELRELGEILLRHANANEVMEVAA